MSEEKKKNNKGNKVAVLFVLLIIIAAAFGYRTWSRGRLTTDDAYVDGHIYSITPRISGYVTRCDVTDNQKVKEGEPLLNLDSMEYEVALAKAKAGLAEAEATLTSLELGVPLEVNQTGYRVQGARAQLESVRRTLEKVKKDEDAAVQEIKRAQAQYELSLLELNRIKGLRTTHAVSQSSLDAAETSVEISKTQVDGTRARVEALKKQRASLEAEMEALKANIGLAATGEELAQIKARQVEAQKARVALAKTQVRQAEIDLSYTTILSPAEGYVTQKRVEPGLMVSRGQPLMAVVPLDPKELWITANYKETQLTFVKPGKDVIIHVDTYPGVEIKGRVDSIMAGTGSAFSLFPPENATGNFVKVVQRIPVKITFDLKEKSNLPVLRIGMSAVPTIFINEP